MMNSDEQMGQICVFVCLVVNARPPAIVRCPARTLLHPSGWRNQHFDVF